VQDLYLEAVDPADPMRYRTPEGWARFDVREETIAVRGQSQAVRMTVRQGRHGPVISDAAGRATQGLTGRVGQPYALALRWTAMDADVGNLAAGIGINRAGSIEDFVAAARTYGAPMQNMIVADRQGPHGRIALVLPGKVPLRRPDNDLLGQFPAPGWLARYDWVGFRPGESLPLVIDPLKGWLATANQRTEPPGAQPPLSREWTRPHRQQRIEQLLTAAPQHDVDSFVRMQRDVQSRGAELLLPAFRAARLREAVAGIDDAGRAALGRIQSTFDGEMAAESVGPTLFHAWVQALTRRILADELGPQWQRQFSERRSWRDAIEDILARQDAWWCDDKRTTDRHETCAEQGDAALRDAVQDLRQRLGPDPATWRWSRLHVVHAEHSPFSRVAPLRRLFELRVPVAGDTQSINAMRVNLRPTDGDPQAYAVEHGPGLRTVLDLADPRRSRWMLSTGQSGIALSPDYASLLEPWSRGETLPLWPTEPPAHRLTLRAVMP
jgi:penicillin amidase